VIMRFAFGCAGVIAIRIALLNDPYPLIVYGMLLFAYLLTLRTQDKRAQANMQWLEKQERELLEGIELVNAIKSEYQQLKQEAQERTHRQWSEN
jgi:hypothetical protein